MTAPHPRTRDLLVVLALIATSFAGSWMVLRAFRAAGLQPSFYQRNFEPAVMMACGRGFGVASPTPATLIDFLQVKRNDFDCGLLQPATLISGPTVAANANWYYLYGAAAAVWRVTGVSWTALDLLVAAFAGLVTVLLYGLFRLVAARGVSAVVALLLTMSPSNLVPMLSLRDYSKAPFVLGAVMVLAVLVMRPMRRSTTFALAALYGAVVGIGYGFRGDLSVMVPFGTLVVLAFLPGSWRTHAVRNMSAAAIVLAAFFITAWPVIRALDKGGCQYHFALLGLTQPLTNALHLTAPLYRLGEHTLDLFGNLKVGEYASRVMNMPVPVWCTADFDAAAAPLYMKMASTFPADFVVRAYASVLMILRLSMVIPTLGPPSEPLPHLALVDGVYWTLHAVTSLIAPFGVLITLAAIGAAWATSPRLGAALAVFVLFQTGYPAIRFEDRHWFHLRFIPWWALLAVGGQLFHRGWRDWPRPILIRAAAGAGVVLVALVVALGVLRVIQTRTVTELIDGYQAAATEPIAVAPDGRSLLRAQWQPRDYGTPPEHRGSDLLVLSLDPTACVGTGPLEVMVKYTFDDDPLGHDLSTVFTLDRPAPGAEPTRVFVPVFWAGNQDHTYLRFDGIEVHGAASSCVGRVARVLDGASLPLWLEVQLPPDWSQRRLYQTIDPPGLLKWLIERPL